MPSPGHTALPYPVMAAAWRTTHAWHTMPHGPMDKPTTDPVSFSKLNGPAPAGGEGGTVGGRDKRGKEGESERMEGENGGRRVEGRADCHLPHKCRAAPCQVSKRASEEAGRANVSVLSLSLSVSLRGGSCAGTLTQSGAARTSRVLAFVRPDVVCQG